MKVDFPEFNSVRRTLVTILAVLLALGSAALVGCGGSGTTAGAGSSEYAATIEDKAQVQKAAEKALEEAYEANPELMRVEVVSVEMPKASYAVLELQALEDGKAAPEDLQMRKASGSWEMVEDQGFGYIILGGPRRR